MSKISIKIVEVHQPSQSVIVKFASEHSRKPIDEYDGLVFTVPNYNVLTPEKFIEAITPQITRLVMERDKSESIVDELDISAWQGYQLTVDTSELAIVEPALHNQIIPALVDPEVII